jgi:hypothetical protein
METSTKALRLATQDMEIQPTEQDDSQNPEPGTAVDDDDMQRMARSSRCVSSFGYARFHISHQS